jgi:hypothetical protein
LGGVRGRLSADRRNPPRHLLTIPSNDLAL